MIIKLNSVIEAEEQHLLMMTYACVNLCKSNNHFSQSNLIVSYMSAVYVYRQNQQGVKLVINGFSWKCLLYLIGHHFTLAMIIKNLIHIFAAAFCQICLGCTIQ